MKKMNDNLGQYTKSGSAPTQAPRLESVKPINYDFVKHGSGEIRIAVRPDAMHLTPAQHGVCIVRGKA